MSLSVLMSAEGKLIDINNPVNCSGNCYEPFANAGEDRTYYQGSAVVLDASLSYDPEEGSLTYTWSAPDGIFLSDNTYYFNCSNIQNKKSYINFIKDI